MSYRWIVRRDRNPGEIWEKYAEVMGLADMKRVYGDHWPPKEARALEEVYVWTEPIDYGKTVAWLSITFDQFDQTSAHMSRGVWPDQHGNGLGREMRAFAENWCRQHGVDTLNISIDASNTKHLALALADPYWRHDSLFWDAEGGTAYGFSHTIE